jgi:hypothetical protein
LAILAGAFGQIQRDHSNGLENGDGRFVGFYVFLLIFLAVLLLKKGAIHLACT